MIYHIYQKCPSFVPGALNSWVWVYVITIAGPDNLKADALATARKRLNISHDKELVIVDAPEYGNTKSGQCMIPLTICEPEIVQLERIVSYKPKGEVDYERALGT